MKAWRFWLLLLLTAPAACEPLAYIWRFGSSPRFAPVSDGKRFFVYADDTLWAGSPQGQVLWKRPMDYLYEAPVLHDGVVVLHSGRGLYGLSAENGAPLWSSANSDLHWIKGRLWSSGKDALELLDPKTGLVLHSVPGTPRWISLDPMVVYLDGQTQRLDPETGQTIWKRTGYGYRYTDHLTIEGKDYDFDGNPFHPVRPGRPGRPAARPYRARRPEPKDPEATYQAGPAGWGLGGSGWLYHQGKKVRRLAYGAHPAGYNLIGWGGDQAEPRVLYLAQPHMDDLQVERLLSPGRHSFDVSGSNLGTVNLSLQQNGTTLWTRQLKTPVQGESRLSTEALLNQPGNYTLLAEAAGIKHQARFQVSRLGSVCKFSASQLDVFVFDYTSKKPAPNIPVTLQGETLRTDASGLVHFRQQVPAQAKVSVAGVEQELHFMHPPALGQLYLRTDRPLYRPGHTVEFFTLVDPQGQHQVSVQLRDPSDNLLQTLQLESDANGLVSGNFTLSAEAPLGRYRVLAECPDLKTNQSLPLEVQAYRKPPFELKVAPSQSLYVQGQTIPVQLASQYFFGGPVPHAKIKVEVSADRLWDEPSPPDDYEPNSQASGWWSESVYSGEVETDDQGRAHLEIPSKKGPYDQLYSITASAVGPEGQPVEAAGSAIVTPASFGIYVQPVGWAHVAGERFPIRVHTVDRLGKPHSAAFRLQIGKRILRGHTDSQGRALVPFEVKQAGYLELLASSQDERGRKMTDESYVWVGGDGDYSWPRLEIVSNRHKVKPGSTLKILLLSSQPGPVWVTVEGKRVLWQQVVQLKHNSQAVLIPVRADWQGALEIHAHSGDTSTSTAFVVDNQLGKMDLQLTPDRPDYRPGKSALLHVQASQPAALVLSLVDDALYHLRPEYAANIYQALHSSRHEVEEVELLPQKGRAAGFQTIQPPVQVRSEFKDTAFWKVGILTDEQGRAEVNLPLPDNLTRWRGIVQGVSRPPGALQVGQAQTTLVTKLPVSVRTIVPRFAVERDHFQVRAVVNNQLPQSVQARAEIQKLAAGAAEVSAQGTRTFEKELEAPAFSDKSLQVTSEVRTETEADAERREVPLLPFGSRHKEYLNGGAGEFEVQAPPDVRQARLEVRLTPNLVNLIESSLDYLADYPYGCAEQTMSRFAPTLVAIKASQRLGVSMRKPVDAMVAASLQKLYGYQHDDGGWGWWTYDHTHPYMTGYVLAGLTQARDLGYTVDAEVITRGIACARRLLQDELDSEVRAYLTWSLTLAGEKPELKDDPSLSLYAQALILQAAVKQNQAPLAQTLAARLKARALTDPTEGADHPHLSGPEQAPGLHWQAGALTSYGFLDDDLEATCQILRGLVALDPHDPQVSQGLNWVLSRRRGQAWKTTKDTAQVVYLLSDLLGDSPNPAHPALSLDGQSQQVEEKGEQLRVIPLQAGQKLKVSLSGVHSAALQLGWVDPPYSTQLPAQPNPQFSLQRSYYKGRQQLFAPLHLKPQEEVTVQLDLVCEKPLQYVMLQDYRAAGMEAVPNSTRSWDYAQREDRDDRSIFFFTSLTAGRHTVRYNQRAETPGSFRVLPALMELMYQPDLQARGGSDALEISPP